MDFFNSIYDAEHINPYTQRGVIYPPLTYLYYRFWGLLLPSWSEMDKDAKAISDTLRGEIFWRNSQSGIIVAFLMTIVTVVLLYHVLMQAMEKTENSRKTVWWLLLGSVPFWFAYERGNLALQTLLFLAYFVTNYRSENKIKRELALISLAISASFKIYPALFGVVLILDKRYKEAVRCVVYGVLLFFLPFLAFGGLESFPIMLSNIMSTTQMMVERGFGYKVNIDNTLAFLMEPFQAQVTGAVSLTLKLLLVLCTIFVLLFTQKDWQRYMVLSAVMIVFPGFSYTYTLIFATIPLIVFLAEKPKTTTRNLLFSLLFLCLFAPFPFGGEALYDTAPKTSPAFIYSLNLTTVLESLSILGMLLLMVWDVICVRYFPEREVRHDSAPIRFVAIVLLLTAVLSGGYLLCDRLYYEAFLLSEEGQLLLKEQETIDAIEETLSQYLEPDDTIAYFSHTPFFESSPWNCYQNITWVKISNDPADLDSPADQAAMQAIFQPLETDPPKAFIYCTYPTPALEENHEVSETYEMIYTLEDCLNRFVFEHRYTLRGNYSVGDAYRVLVYLALQE